MSENKEILLKICRELNDISKSVVELNQRIDRLEGKTDDIHQYVPFVKWLEDVGHSLSDKWLWLPGVPNKSIEHKK